MVDDESISRASLKKAACVEISSPIRTKYKIDPRVCRKLLFCLAGWAGGNGFDSSQVEHESRILPACHSLRRNHSSLKGLAVDRRDDRCWPARNRGHVTTTSIRRHSIWHRGPAG